MRARTERGHVQEGHGDGSQLEHKRRRRRGHRILSSPRGSRGRSGCSGSRGGRGGICVRGERLRARADPGGHDARVREEGEQQRPEDGCELD